MTDKQLKMRQLGMEASYLAACALHGKAPEGKVSDPEMLYKFCKFHTITSIVAMALEETWKTTPADEAVMKKWRQDRDKAIRKNILLNAERERILSFLESIGCWYMPLKGSLLQYDYPKFGMRQMSDNDLLVDPEKSAWIRDFMVENGYSCEQFLQGHHDEYNRKPVYNFEIHRSLFRAEEAPLLAEYYDNIRQRCEKDSENGFGYHMSRSDFYIYLMVHAYNHFQESGIGIRHLLDVYVFLSKYEKEMDSAYVHRELEKLGAVKFERWCARMAGVLFSQPCREPDLMEEDLDLLDAFFCSGAHGTEEQLLQKSYEKFAESTGDSRFRYFLHRMFPSQELLGVMYPVVKKHGWAIPFIWIYRLVRSVFSRPGRVFRELGNLLRRRKKI